MSRERANAVAAWATGSGIGLIALMLTWLLGNRLIALFVDPPAGPVAALVAALVSGTTAAVVSGRRLRQSITGSAAPEAQAHRRSVRSQR